MPRYVVWLTACLTKAGVAVAKTF